jgi:hypothetical protein
MKYTFRDSNSGRVYAGRTLAEVRRQACVDLSIESCRGMVLLDEAGREIAVTLEEGGDWERGPGPLGRITGNRQACYRYWSGRGY